MSPGVAGYHVYYGTASGQYFSTVFVTINTSITVSGLREGTTYYFVVTAYDDSGLESDPSNEVAYTVPCPTLRMQQILSAEFPTAFSIVSGSRTIAQWALEASEDLRTWRTLSQGTNSVPNVAVLISPPTARFFRLRSQTAGVSLVTHIPPDGFANSFFITAADPSPSQWVMETSSDLMRWSPFTAGTNSPPNVAVIISTAPKMFFRLRIQ